MNKDYGHAFYQDRHQQTVYSAQTILSLVLEALPPVHSATDFGCGVGTWLSVLKEKGISDIQGMDGPWVDQNLLEIPAENFQQTQFGQKIELTTKYDLAISLEVAEHLSKESAKSFVESLTDASDSILFSAAIPHQGGQGHINEQWPDYWIDLFAEKGYIAVDFIREKIWNDTLIPVWYRQNIMVFVKKEKVDTLNIPGLEIKINQTPFSMVHPELYFAKISEMQSLKGTWKLFRRAVKSYIKKKVNIR